MTRIQLDYYCPLIRGEFPKSPCPFALEAIRKLRSYNAVKFELASKHLMTDAACDWYVIDRASHYCWFKYWANPENQREYTLEEISKLLGYARELIFFIEAKALENLRRNYRLMINGDIGIAGHEFFPSDVVGMAEVLVTRYRADLCWSPFSHTRLADIPRPISELITNKPFRRAEQLSF